MKDPTEVWLLPSTRLPVAHPYEARTVYGEIYDAIADAVEQDADWLTLWADGEISLRIPSSDLRALRRMDSGDLPSADDEADTVLSQIRDALGLDNDPSIDLLSSARDICRELDQAHGAIRSVLHIHRGEGHRGQAICAHCSALDDQGSTDNSPIGYPCDTVKRIWEAGAQRPTEPELSDGILCGERPGCDGQCCARVPSADELGADGLTEVERLRKSVARVRAIHEPVEHQGWTICADYSTWTKECGTDNPSVPYPCATIQALDGEADHG